MVEQSAFTHVANSKIAKSCDVNALFPPAKLSTSSHLPASTAEARKRRAKKRKYPQGVSLMAPQSGRNDHPFLPTLRRWATHGVPVDCGEDWTWEAIEEAVARGPHRSALTPESLELFSTDIEYQRKAGFLTVIPWSEVRQLRPRHLKISPVAVVPQINRRGRIILDLSFPVYPRSASRKRPRPPIVPSVNETTVPLAPTPPVKELGNVLWRIFHLMSEAGPNEDVHFQKVDLSDGFWRMIVQEEQKWNFCYVLPQAPGQETMIVVPSALQMGWAESPGFFASTTETVRDLIHKDVRDPESETAKLPHALETYTEPHQPAKRSKTDHPIHGEYVYIDDFVNAAVEDREGTLLRRVARATLHNIHSVFPPPEVTGHVGGKDSVSMKKAEKGDMRWDPEKEVLGLDLDGRRRTVALPKQKAEGITTEIRRVLKKNSILLARYRKLVGKLRHAAIIMPAIRGLFTPINQALKADPKAISLPKDGSVRGALRDFVHLVESMAERPTHVKELVEGPDHQLGYCDAAAEGAGGVWFGQCLTNPVVWRLGFPHEISSQVISEENPTGTITNSDLELAATMFQLAVLARITSLKHRRSGVLSDNSAAVYWVHRMASRSQTNVSGSILRGMAMFLRTLESGPVTIAHTPGEDNVMADFASRSFVTYPFPQDNEFLQEFKTRYPLPTKTWTLVAPPKSITRLVMSALLGRRSALPDWTRASESVSGPTGAGIVGDLAPMSTLSFGTCSSPTESISCWDLLSPSGVETTVEDIQSVLNPLKRRFASYAKGSNWMDSQTLDGHTEDTT